MARIIDQAACGGASLPRSASGNSWLLPTSMKLVEQQGQLSPPRVTQALVAAAARITTPDSFTNPRQLIRVDGAPVIIHLLRGLQASGIIRAVITLGHAAQLLAEEVKKHSFGAMVVEFVWCEASSWKRGHASNILAARSMFPKVKAIATPGRPTPPRGCMPRHPPPARRVRDAGGVRPRALHATPARIVACTPPEACMPRTPSCVRLHGLTGVPPRARSGRAAAAGDVGPHLRPAPAAPLLLHRPDEGERLRAHRRL